MTSTQPEHTQTETDKWSINIPDHPAREDSPEYVAARAKMNELAGQATGLVYGPGPFQDHHGSALWLQDSQGWFMVRNLAGIEWSAQFCADPAKVDLLRQNANRLYDLLAPQIKQQLDPDGLLDTPIQDAAGVAKWTDSIFNAGLPLQQSFHIGVLFAGDSGGAADSASTDDSASAADSPSAAASAASPASASAAASASAVASAASPASASGAGAGQAPAAGQPENPPAAADAEPAGLHHYPTPVVDIQLFKYDDFQLWVVDDEGNPAAVAPMAVRGSGDRRVHVLYATPGSQLAKQKQAAERANMPLILGPEHPLAKQAFQNQ
jgi:hypothetical protein